jgi:hypothetical protein
MKDHLYTTREAADILNVSPSFLEKDRCFGSRIPFIRLASRTIRYRASDLADFLDGSTHLSTSEYPDESIDLGEDEDAFDDCNDDESEFDDDELL